VDIYQDCVTPPGKTVSDNGEDFNLGGRGHRASPEEGVVHPRLVRLKIE
jgi:hypothetical protein